MPRHALSLVRPIVAALLSVAVMGCAQVRVPAIDPTGARILAPYETTLAEPLAGESRCVLFPRPAFAPAPAIPACPQPATSLPIAIAAPAATQPAIPVLQPAPMAMVTLGDPCASVPCPGDPCAAFLVGEPECPPLESFAPPCPPIVTPVVQPAQPVVVPQPVVAAPVAPTTPKIKSGGTDAISISPARVVAGVGTEVVFRSSFASGKGGCGKTVEWVLAQGSVGHLIDVGGDVGCNFLCNHKADGQNGTFKVGKAIKKSQLLTRNLADPRDDILVAPGESWVSVTSPTEGVSFISAMSPDDAPGWNPSRQAATVFWIDAQWALPQPVSVAAGGRQVLTTNLRRASTGAALPGWIVRYSIAGGAPAGFGPTSAPSADVLSDASGAASVEIVQPSPTAGATQVRIQIIRPLAAGGNLPELTVGDAGVQVLWSAPGLAVNVQGPPQAMLDQPIVYRVEVSNPGDQAATNVVLSDTPPPGLAFVASNPPAELFGDRLEWNLGDLAARSSRVVEIQMKGAEAGDVKHCLRAQSYTLSAEGCALTRIFSQTLSLNVSGPQQAEVGQTVTYTIDVSNTGASALEDVRLVDRFDAGLRRPDGETSPLSRSLGRIEAGTTQQATLEFIVDAPGQLSHIVEVTSADGQRAATRPIDLTAILAAPVGQPDMRVRLSGPPQRSQGEVAEYYIEVTNSGDAPLTNVRVAFTASPSLSASLATDGYRAEAGALVWRIAELAPGATSRFQVNCVSERPDAAAESTLSVTCDQNITLSDRSVTRILPGAPPAQAELEPPPQRPFGELKLTVSGNRNPARVGQEIEYTITVRNDRNVNDREIALTINIPLGLTYKSLSGDFGVRRIREDQLIVYCTPIAEMRPGDTRSARLTVTAAKPGMHSLVVRATSEGSRTPVEIETSTTVLAEP